MKRWFLWEITIKKGRNLTFHYIPTCFHSHESLSRHDDNPCNNNPRDPRRHRVLYDLCDDTLFRNDLSYHDPAFVHYNRDDLRCNINRPPIRDHSDNRHCVRSQNHNPHRRDVFFYTLTFFTSWWPWVSFSIMAILFEIFASPSWYSSIIIVIDEWSSFSPSSSWS